MKSIIKSLQKDPCREREISDNERESLSVLHHLQRYFPAMDQFRMNGMNSKEMELPTKYYIQEWKSIELEHPNHPKVWKAIRSDGEECKVFTKIIHLLNPIDMIREKYTCPDHPLLPQSENTWKKTLVKLHSQYNQAYVDAIANFVLSRFRELDLTPHCVLSYGNYTGISQSYPYVISEEYDSYRQCRWFWNGMKCHSANLTLVHKHPNAKEDPEFMKLYNEITSCPLDFESDEELDDLDESCDIESLASFSFEHMEHTDSKSPLHSPSLSPSLSLSPSPSPSFSSSPSPSPSFSSSHSHSHSSHSHSSLSQSSGDSDDTIMYDMDIVLKIPNMPVILIAQEAQEGVMDSLMDEDVIDGFERGTQGWESRWIAWIFQVIASLTFLQSAIAFTHNDLHSNNIVWMKTNKKYLYYKLKNDGVWRVPTYGYIFRIIDFGRSIFRLGKRLWVSDDHWPEHDAGGQYNFGPFFNAKQTKYMPNPSFDLARLSVSLIDGLFDERPAKKKGKAVSIISEEGTWKVYETKSHLFNLLWSWTVDDAGRTIYENEDGTEKYDGFDMYIHIAQELHGAVPVEQLHRPIFQSFIWKNKVPVNEKVYQLD